MILAPPRWAVISDGGHGTDSLIKVRPKGLEPLTPWFEARSTVENVAQLRNSQ
jgi:hypothetical protein